MRVAVSGKAFELFCPHKRVSSIRGACIVWSCFKCASIESECLGFNRILHSDQAYLGLALICKEAKSFACLN